jgi:hypothetical protein
MRGHLWMREAASRCKDALRNGLFVAGLAAGVFLAPEPASSQDLHPSRRPSPIGIAKSHIAETYVKVTYGRPYIRGRRIFGAPGDTVTYLVPFGQLWRTGANEATELTTTAPLQIAGQRLAAGTYAIFTVPAASSWEVRFSPQLGLDGTGRSDEESGEFTADVYDPSRDVLRVTVPSGGTSEDVDQFTIEFEKTGTGADMVMRWERTEVRVPIAAAR